eukprot:TRINITY_DN11681_c0_g1_i2.p2 TRINITY_DN11681_c0_g1~~TRINITY_DN11681_c0_g1_i2.p2  ORF type:complete len:199 (+),score=-21.29 TRINITY_DN11681_c0_g1_i2:538-1134(+)
MYVGKQMQKQNQKKIPQKPRFKFFDIKKMHTYQTLISIPSCYTLQQTGYVLNKLILKIIKQRNLSILIITIMNSYPVFIFIATLNIFCFWVLSQISGINCLSYNYFLYDLQYSQHSIMPQQRILFFNILYDAFQFFIFNKIPKSIKPVGFFSPTQNDVESQILPNSRQMFSISVIIHIAIQCFRIKFSMLNNACIFKN